MCRVNEIFFPSYSFLLKTRLGPVHSFIIELLQDFTLDWLSNDFHCSLNSFVLCILSLWKRETKVFMAKNWKMKMILRLGRVKKLLGFAQTRPSGKCFRMQIFLTFSARVKILDEHCKDSKELCFSIYKNCIKTRWPVSFVKVATTAKSWQKDSLKTFHGLKLLAVFSFY